MNENKNAGTGFIPVYRHSAEYAISHDELEAYRASCKANKECRMAIEEAIQQNYHDNRLDTKTTSVQLGQKFSPERLSYVLANTIQQKSWDGRFSEANKAWAASVSITEDKSEWGEDRNRQFSVNGAHPGLVDLLANQIRKELAQVKEQPEKKPSILEKLQKPLPALQTSDAPKKAKEFSL